MLIKDKDILSNSNSETQSNEPKAKKYVIDRRNMKQAWGDAFDYYFRGITEKYLSFHERASRLEFWGFMASQGIIFFPLYFISEYVDMPLLVYYFYFATLIPMVAVLVRRFHDINKKASLYLFLGILSVLSAFVLGYFSFILFLAWFAWMAYMLFRPSYNEIGIFGVPLENDEVYGQDNEPILKKFRFLAMACLFIILILTGVNFDNWRRQNAQKSAIDHILSTAEIMSMSKSLSDEQSKEVQKQVLSMLKSMDGQVVSEKEIQNNIVKIIDQINKVKTK